MVVLYCCNYVVYFFLSRQRKLHRKMHTYMLKLECHFKQYMYLFMNTGRERKERT